MQKSQSHDLACLASVILQIPALQSPTIAGDKDERLTNPKRALLRTIVLAVQCTRLSTLITVHGS